MKVHDVKQGSQDWLRLRAGIPTASEFDQIITPTGKPSKSAARLLHTLLAERIMDRPVVGHVSWDMERGSRLEQEAVDLYEMLRDVDTEEVGFCTTDDGRIGASPDRLVGADGLLEIKCPAEHTHVGYMLHKPVDKAYYPQIMGQLWVCEREWVEIMSYHPDMPEAVVRVERDEEWIAKLAAEVRAFSDHLEEQWLSLEQQLERGRPVDPLELQREDVPA